MENDLIKERVQKALDCVQGLDEPYRGIAFQVILKELLREGSVPEVRRIQRSDHPPKSFPPINEFFSAVHPKAYTDAVITIAYHLLHGEKVQSFTIQDIAESLSKCRAEKPKNLSDVLAGCARNGWLAEGNQKQRGMKSWYLTSTGEKYFQSKLNPAGMGGVSVGA
ncbi:MAG: hypothetical protein LLH30_10645 [Candidatus Manganitrophus sp. SA1]|nr:hypothetical protein [Candidatus Manganitrophus morganii]MCG3116127.1 hypothetical protein [Candidatus Manganitrophus morganii]